MPLKFAPQTASRAHRARRWHPASTRHDKDCNRVSPQAAAACVRHPGASVASPISKWGDECGKDEENIAAAPGMLSQLLPDAYIVSMHEGGAPRQASLRQTSAQQVCDARSGQAPARSAARSAMQHVCCWCASTGNPLKCMCHWSMSQQNQQWLAWQRGQHSITTMLHKVFNGAGSWRS